MVLRHNENPKFFFYIISTLDYKKQINKLKTGTTVYHISPSKIKKIKIPLPPRHIQDLIADYLDHWTNLEQELEKELEKELANRKKQYQYYKELILTSEKDKWEIKSLSEIATEVYSGNEVTKAQLGTGDYPAIRYSEIHNSNIYITENKSFINPHLIKNKKYCEYGDFLITRVSEDMDNAGKAVAYLGKKCILGAAILLAKHRQNPKYLSYVWSTKFIRQQISEIIPRGTLMNFRTSYINKIHIPLPPLKEQERIAAILDKFRTIVEDLEEGIPKLLAQARQQYEYYKEKILTF